MLANAYGNKFIIPLDFEMLDSAMPYYRSGLGNILPYKITFNLSGKTDANYEIKDVSLEYEIIAYPDLTRHITMKYQKMALSYNRILRNRQIPVNKSDITLSFNMPCRSFILVLFKEKKLFTPDISKFYNPKIEKVSIIITRSAILSRNEII